MLTTSDIPAPQRRGVGRQSILVPTNAESQNAEGALNQIFKAKCRDLDITAPSSIQRKRFVDIARANCSPPYFSIATQGLGAESAKKVVQYLAGAGNGIFTSLDLSCNKLADYGAAALAWLIARDESLIMLNVASNSIGADGGELLLHALTDNQHLTSINLSTIPGVNRNKVGPRGASALAAALLSNQVLATVNIGQNSIGPAGMASIASALPFNISLTQLNLASNSIGAEGCSVLADGLAQSSLLELDLSCNGIGDQGIQLLSEALPLNKTLQSLVLNENKITHKGAHSLGKALERNATNLESLSVKENAIQKAGADALAGSLRSALCKLETLDMQQCKLNAAGAASLLHAAGQSKTLKALTLSRNELADVDGTAAAGAIANGSLVSLDLSDNCISDAGGSAIANALAGNASLTKLSLRGNYLHEPSGTAFANAMQHNSTLMKLDVEGNQLSHTVFKEIGVSIVGNKVEQSASEVDRLWEELDHMRLKELKLFDTQRELAENREAADAAELDVAQHSQRVSNCEEELRMQTQKLKSLQEDCESERQDLQHQLSSLNDEIDRWGRQTEERNYMLSNRIEKEVENRKSIDKEINLLKKELDSNMKQANKAEHERTAALETAKMEYESTLRDANFQDERIEQFIGSLPPGLRDRAIQFLNEQDGNSGLNDVVSPAKHRWSAEESLGEGHAEKPVLPPSRHSRYSNPNSRRGSRAK